VVSAGNYSDDIDDQGTFNNTHSTIETANNYGYDELGNLVRDAQEEIASIEWTVYGKMKKITRTGASSKADLEFGYDASGNRLWKKVTPKGSGAVISTYYYLRDAQGNEMCRYVKYTNTSSQLMYVAQEHSIYGSSRVGVDNRKDTLYKAGNYSPSWGGISTSRRDLGSKSFELANHLGNVLVTVSDKPIYKVSSATIFFQPEVTSISDYYPFGAPIHGRGYSSEGYRFGYNTQEKTDEIAGPGNHNTATFWEYDTRLGRRWNQDPKIVIGVSHYAINGDNPIFYTDPLGDFRTKFGAQVYRFIHGGKIVEDANGEYYVNRSFTDRTGVLNIKPRAYDLMGNSRPAQSGGGIDFSNSSLALDIGGEIFGGLQGLTSSKGYWLGKNGKYYSNSWGGNQFTGGRSGAFNAASDYKLAGRATLIGSALIGIYNTRVGYQMDGGQFGYNAQMAAAGSVGSIAGGIVGAKAGAVTGAAIGVWFGGFGAIPGALIGGVIGGFGFGIAGGYYGGQLGGSAVNYYHGR